MLYKQDWELVQKKYLEYWELENHDRPLLSIRAPKDIKQGTLPPVKDHATLKERWYDTEYAIEKANYHFKNTYFGAEALPIYWPNLGPDIFAAFYGIKLEFGESTSWAQHLEYEWEEYKPFIIDKQNSYYQKVMEMTEAAVEDARDKYLVGVTDLHPGADALVAMRGPEQLCIDLLERSEFVKRAVMDLFQGFKEVYDDLHTLTTRYQTGTTNWLGVWHPGKWYVTSCDFNALISTAMFEEFMMQELETELDFLDASIFHLDGPDALRHLDRLLEIDKLKGIQWVYGAGQPSAAHWLDVLKKIQNAGKLIHVDIIPEDLDVLLENLRPEGVLFSTYVRTQEEAEALVKKVERTKKTIF